MKKVSPTQNEAPVRGHGSGISLVIPCHNAEPWLAETLNSVLAQSLPPDDCLVVDDGSTDASRAIAECYGPPIRVISRRGGSAAATRNLGAAEVGGQALMFLDADDVLDPGALETLWEGLAQAPEGIALAPWRRLELDSERVWRVRPPSCAPRRLGQDLLSAWLTGWYHPPCCVLWSRPALERVGQWDPLVGCNDDGDLMMRALACDTPFVAVVGGGAFYRRLPASHPSLSSTRFSSKGIESRLYVLEKIARLLDSRGRMRRYRGPLGEALERVIADCGVEHADLAERGRALLASFAEPAWRRAPRGLVVRIAERLARLRGADGSGPVRPVSAPMQIAGPSLSATPAPRVSVILPVNDRAPVVGRAITSVLEQSVSDLELLVIDDGSTDDLDAVLRDFPDPRLRLLRHHPRRGAAAARNRGLREARGSYIAFLDSDDFWFPGSLAAQLARFDAAPRGTGLVFGLVERRDHQGRLSVVGHPADGDIHRAMLARNVVIGPPAVMLRREVVDRVGLFDEGMPACEDYDYWIRVSRDFSVACIEQPLYRWHDGHDPLGKQGSRLSDNIPANLRARARLYAKHGAAMRAAGTAHRFLLTTAQRRLRQRGAGGQRELVMAIRLRPIWPLSWAWLCYGLLPWFVRERLRRLRWLAAGQAAGAPPAPLTGAG